MCEGGGRGEGAREGAGMSKCGSRPGGVCLGGGRGEGARGGRR